MFMLPMSNMETSLRRRRKILLHFFLGIGLPSLLLGYLAFRGIQNDAAFVERQRLEEHRAITQQITSSIDDKISTVEAAFLESIAGRPSPQQVSAVLRSMELLKSEQPLVEEIFLFESPERIQLPLAKLLFLPDGSAKPVQPQSRPPTLSLGEQYEFQQKRHQEALTSYQQAFAEASDRQVKGEALNAIARVQTKSNLLADAIESYKTIAQDYSDMRMGNGIPLGLAARLELGALFHAIDDSGSAVQTFLRLYESLIRGEWALEESQYEFFTQQVELSIGDIFSQDEAMQSHRSALEKLRSEEARQREIMERPLTFQENAAPDLLARVSRNMEGPPNGVRRFTFGIRGHTYFVSMPDERKEEGNQVKDIWGLLLDPEQLKVGLLKPVIQQHVSLGDIHWIIRGREDETILQSDTASPGTMTVSAGFVRNFPPWSLELYQQAPRLLETLLTSRRGIYSYMFILLAGILIFGLTLTIRIVTNEFELGRMKSDFVSTVSHEFKSPLTSIRQLSEMLQAGRVPSQERRQRYYNVLLEQSERLSLLVDNILDFATMEEGKRAFEFELVDMAVLLEELVSTIQQQVHHEEFAVEAEIDTPLPSIQVDRAAITQAITNLIDNAIKYSGESKKVCVRAFSEDRYLVIAVQDFGIGVKPEEIEKVFERFYRGGDELTRTVKGSGLGLTLVRQIVEAHHGSVHVESEPGLGSTFSIRLPLQSTEV
jgi:signal transduction histidine kinase